MMTPLEQCGESLMAKIIIGETASNTHRQTMAYTITWPYMDASRGALLWGTVVREMSDIIQEKV
jgi:hypothetical protein